MTDHIGEWIESSGCVGVLVYQLLQHIQVWDYKHTWKSSQFARAYDLHIHIRTYVLMLGVHRYTYNIGIEVARIYCTTAVSPVPRAGRTLFRDPHKARPLHSRCARMGLATYSWIAHVRVYGITHTRISSLLLLPEAYNPPHRISLPSPIYISQASCFVTRERRIHVLLYKILYIIKRSSQKCFFLHSTEILELIRVSWTNFF